MIQQRSCIVALLLTLTAALGFAEPPPDKRVSLLSNGEFEKLDGKDWPVDWPHPEGVTFEKEDATRFLRLRSAKPNQMVQLFRRVDLPSSLPAGLEIRLRVRYSDIKAGKEKWHDGRVIGHFKSKSGRTLKPEPSTPTF